uniref:Uncharacterized protein n=1 Tax=Monopterus albus TaxID=43700 RepID=A0A3Q3Q4N4_MONAL
DLEGGTALPETPEMERVKRNQQNISMVFHRYKDSMGQGTAIPDPPEVKRVRDTQKNISLVEEQTCSYILCFVGLCLTLYLCNLCNGQIQYKDSVGQGTAIRDPPEVKRVRDNQKNISLVEEQACSDPFCPFIAIP